MNASSRALRLRDREGALFDLHLRLGRELQDRGAGDAVQDVVRELAGDDRAVPVTI